MKKLGFPALLVSIVAVMIGIFIIGNRGAENPAQAKIEGLKTFNNQDRNHVKETVQYAQTPAAGGNHDAVWPDCNGKAYDQPLRNENAVHALEHGAVWVTYKEGTEQKQVDALKKKITGKQYVMMSPLADQSDQIMMTAWNNQLSLSSADDSKFDQFMTAFSQSSSAPEPGATCSAAGGGAQPGGGAPTAPGGGLNPGESAEDHAKESQQ